MLLGLKNWNEAPRRATEGSRLAPEDPMWLRWQLEALDHLRRPADALAVARALTDGSHATGTVGDWITRARLARTVTDDDAEVRAALDAAAGLAVPNDPAIAQARRELLPPPISPVQFPARLATLGFVPRKDKDPDTGKAAAYIVPPTCPVAAGPFQYGEGNTVRTVDLPAFAIARYPVTVAEYACFVRAGQREPANWQDQLRTKLDHPVVSVTWHDATAYATWLARLSGQPWRVPSEEEWEKAARWDHRTSASRIYPWGDTFDAARCNTKESGIGTTTPVGKYGASGASSCGAEDLAGNVWEWTNSTYDSSTDYRVLRGGSWNDGQHSALAAGRYRSRPAGPYGNFGFRLAVAPVRAGS